MDAVCGKDSGCGLCEHIALDAGVIADRHRLAAALGLYPVGKALGRLADHPDVHAVRAGSDHAAKTSCSEFQGHSEAVLDLSIISLNAHQLRLEIGILQICSKPALIHVLIHCSALHVIIRVLFSRREDAPPAAESLPKSDSSIGNKKISVNEAHRWKEAKIRQYSTEMGPWGRGKDADVPARWKPASRLLTDTVRGYIVIRVRDTRKGY